MSTKEGSAVRGQRRGREIILTLLAELRNSRVAADVSGRAVASKLGWSEARYRRFESGARKATISEVSTVAAVLGLEVSAKLHPAGPPIRDRGHQSLLARVIAELGTAWKVTRELPFANLGDPRTWDLGLRIPEQSVGLEAETRARDIQALTRRMHQRERDGGMDEIVLVLARTAHNTAVLMELLEALGPGFATPSRQILRALREGRPIPGSGVILL